MNRLTHVLVIATVAVWAVPAAAQDLGRFRDWSAHQFTEEGQGFCLMWTQPKKSAGKYSRRGEIYATVAHRPAQQKFGVVTFEMGYPFAPGKELSVSIDGGSAIRIPADEDEDSEDESIMWHASAEVNRRLVGAMREGLAMVATGRSKRGTKTVDTYSLHGFSAAYQAISRACGAP
jgi:hypothetical protein